ncbi:MAG: DUF2157 domain-containing protein [Deltaproteobacteria bacterium]|nr:DUF2157 domain-containing protein [Deltaproteobacteria bacterium]
MSDPLDRDATPEGIFALAGRGLVDADEMVSRLERGPAAAVWFRLADVALGLGGVGFLASAVIYAVAFNWDDLGKMAHFGVVAAALALATGVAAWRWPSVGAKASLLGAFLVTGALLALFGQTYQTGVDPWQLFATWAALALPWALVARMPALWAGEVVVLNVGLGLWWAQADRLGGLEAGYALAVLDLLAWGASEATARWLPGRWLPRALVLAALVFATWAGGSATWGHGPEGTGLALWALVVLACLAGGVRDPAIWALGGTSVLVQTASFLGKHGIAGERPLEPLEGAARLGGIGLVLVLEILVLSLAIRWGARRVRDLA